MLTVADGPTASDPMMSHYLNATWGKLCQALGHDFAPLLPVIMPTILRAAAAKTDVSIICMSGSTRFAAPS